MRVIQNTPTWEWAVKIYCEVLSNENATAQAKKSARADLIDLARMVDRQRQEEKKT